MSSEAEALRSLLELKDKEILRLKEKLSQMSCCCCGACRHSNIQLLSENPIGPGEFEDGIDK